MAKAALASSLSLDLDLDVLGGRMDAVEVPEMQLESVA
jgi:hypothetical protein